jgi:hypothetical protein
VSEVEKMKYLVASSIQKALALRRSLNQLKTGDYPSDSPIVLTELLLALSDNIIDRLIRLGYNEQSDLDDIEPEEVLVLGRAVAQLVRFAEPVALSRAEYVPWSLVFPVEMLCRRISPESRVIIYPQWEYNFTYYEVRTLLTRIMDGIAGASGEALFRGYPRYFAVLSFPASEGLNILQNAAWGHEIGHHLNAVFGVVNRVMGHPILDAGDVEAAVDAIRGASDEEGLPLESREQMRVAVLETVTRLTKNWVSELVADLFSVHVFGPASLFAFADMVSVLYPLDQPDPAHPPARFRMLAMLNELRELGYEELFTTPSTTDKEVQVKASVSAELTRLRAISEERPEIRIEPYYVPVLKASQRAIPHIANGVRNVRVGRWACSAKALEHDVFKLIDRLVNGVPPCEVDVEDSLVGLPTRLAAIVNAGWFYRIWRRSEMAPQNETEARHRREQLDQLNELILKAIELSDIRRQLRTKESLSGSGGDSL